MEWIPERVLQKYVQKNKEKFAKHFDGTITSVLWNDDRYPDLTFVIDGDKKIPVEVEWKTSNFIQHKHPPEVLLDGNGLLIVGKIEPECDVGKIKQVELNLEDFEKWFQKNSEWLVKETTKDLHEIDKKRTIPKLWFTYLSFKGDGVSHFETALKHQVWGIQENYNPTADSQIKGIKKGDLIAFVGPGKNYPGRVPLSDWIKKSFKGYFEKIRVYKVTSDYIYETTKIWKGKGKWASELYPHRFRFDKNPLILVKNCKINKLGLTSKKELHSAVYSNIRMVDPYSLVDILHHSEQLSLSDSKNELEYLSKL